MNFTGPLIAVKDVDASRKFYEDLLDQQVMYDFGPNILFASGFSIQSKATWAEFIGKSEAAIIEQSNSFELYFEEEEFDRFVEKLKSYPIQYVHDVREYPWGQRVIRFYDSDLHIIEVGESMVSVARRFVGQGLTIEETAQRTQHPIEFVKAACANR